MKLNDAALKELGLWPLWKLRHTASSDNTQVIDYIDKNNISATAENGDRRASILRMDATQLNASIAACTQCDLHKARKQTVPGVGDDRAEWFFVGEAPGDEENLHGEPFVGQAGKLLDNMLAAIDLTRAKNVYITNVVKCLPPGDRNPTREEAGCCEPYLRRQIALVAPKLIVALGKVAAHNLLGTDDTIAHLRGKLHDAQGIPLIVTYHPAYLLRTPADKARAWEDLCFARSTMAGLSAKKLSPAD